MNAPAYNAAILDVIVDRMAEIKAHIAVVKLSAKPAERRNRGQMHLKGL